MNDVEHAVRHALHGAVAPIEPLPDVGDVARRRRRRVHRRRVTAMAVVVVLLVVAGAGVGWRVASRQPAMIEALSDQVCAIPVTMPFHPVGLDAPHWEIDPYDARQGLALWSSFDPRGVIEVWNGGRGELPEPTANVETITVLGRPAVIGDISDGSSVVVQLGSTVCDRWALVAHPQTSRDELYDIAVALQPN